MCRTCGCGMTESNHTHDHDHPSVRALPRTVRLEHDLLAKNDALALKNRSWFEEQAVLAVNVIGSPGSGKTALLEATIVRLRDECSLAVIEGDQATSRDAERIEKAGCRV